MCTPPTLANKGVGSQPNFQSQEGVLSEVRVCGSGLAWAQWLCIPDFPGELGVQKCKYSTRWYILYTLTKYVYIFLQINAWLGVIRSQKLCNTFCINKFTSSQLLNQSSSWLNWCLVQKCVLWREIFSVVSSVLHFLIIPIWEAPGNATYLILAC